VPPVVVTSYELICQRRIIMPGKTQQQLKEMLNNLVTACILLKKPYPKDYEDICKLIFGNGDLNSAEKKLAAWNTLLNAPVTTSISPTEEDVRVLNSNRAVHAQNLPSASPLAPASPPLAVPRSPLPGTAGVSGPGLAAAKPLGDEIVRFASIGLSKNKQVGDGECWTLVNTVMKLAGAVPPSQRKNPYQFGMLIGKITATDRDAIKQVQAGDILQFKNATFVIEKTTGAAIQKEEVSVQHHTAIVLGIPVGGKVKVAESNVDGNKTPQKGEYDFNYLRVGLVELWRAQANS
jgi:hypothetical protein